MASKRSRTAVKTLTWRVLATTDTFLISYIITGRFDFAGAIAGIEVATKMILYYLHERAWSKDRGQARGQVHAECIMAC